MLWLNSLKVTPTIKDLRLRAEKVCSKELDKSLPKFKELPANEREEIAYLAQRIVKGLLHSPVACLKKQTGKGNGYVYTLAVRDLFNLDQVKEENDG